MPIMRIALRLGALVLVLAALAVWLGTGAHRGWSRSQAEVRTLDEVTGIEQITYEKRLVMGVEILGGALLTAGLLFGSSWLFRNKQNNNNETTQTCT